MPPRRVCGRLGRLTGKFSGGHLIGMRAIFCAAGISLTFLSVGCQPTQLGQCDLAGARALVFDRSGNPAYAGQAMVEQACSSCHGAQAVDAARRGAPAELDFDMIGIRETMADGSPVPFESETEEQALALARLGGARQTIFDSRFAMYDTVVDGSMPPGDVGAAAFADGGYAYADGTPLPRIDSGEGQEIYRNWLSCNGPVVERTGASVMSPGTACTQSDGSAVGDCVFQVDRAPRVIDPTWTAITDEVFTPQGCLAATCHGDSPAGNDLSLIGLPSAVVVGVAPTAGGTCDGERPIVVAGDAAGSLLFEKLARAPGASGCSSYIAPTSTCGAAMPIGRNAECPALDAVRQWIDAGAADN